MAITVEIENGKIKGYETTKEFAQRLGVDQVVVRQWIYTGKLKVLKVGNTSWVENGTKRPTTPRKR